MNDKQSINVYFNNLAEDYLEHKYANNGRTFMSVRMEKMLSLIDQYCRKDGYPRVLDAGCGPGVLIKKLLERQFYVVGTDLSGEMLKLAAKNLAGRDKWDLVECDIENLNFPENSFDVITTAGVIEYLRDDGRALSEFRRVLRDEGMLIISVTNKYSYNLIFDNIIEILKQNTYILALMNFMSERVFRKGRLESKNFIIRKHSPGLFMKELTDMKFAVMDSTYFYFLPLPRPFDMIFPKFCGKVGALMERFGKTGLGFLGEGYLIICRKHQ